MTKKMCETPEQELPRAELARRIGAAWARSGCLAQERIEARLKRRFDGQKKRGLSDSSFNRYKDPTATALPDPAVLIALAQIFHVDEGETKEWARLLDLARAEERRRRAARGRRTSSPAPSPLEPTQATPGHAAPDPAGCLPVPVSPVPGARMPSGSAAPTTGVPVTRRGRRYHGAAAVAAVTAAALVASWAVSDPSRPSSPGHGAPSEGPVGPAAVTATASPGPMTGDYRCGVERAVAWAAWSACTQVLDDGDTVRFALQINNPGSRALTVRARLSWVRSQGIRPCPRPWGNGVRLTVPAGQVAITPLAACAQRADRPRAYQAMAWVIASSDMSWGTRETSQSVHIQADAYRWNDQLS
ncbi:hypothetical protein ACIO6T_23425 [Streptomyces sp. NPDC087532]|uniref:hypothetical protein n=1 Tax=Streptomyces sp. NPDC087532 TaxID=3365795 RepID=UPI0038037512